MEKKSNKEPKMGVVKGGQSESQKLTYEQLEQVAGNLNTQCKQLYSQLQEVRTVIAEFNEINLLLSIIDKSEHFDSNFIDRCCLKIQAVISKAMDAAEKASEESESKED